MWVEACHCRHRTYWSLRLTTGRGRLTPLNEHWGECSSGETPQGVLAFVCTSASHLQTICCGVVHLPYVYCTEQESTPLNRLICRWFIALSAINSPGQREDFLITCLTLLWQMINLLMSALTNPELTETVPFYCSSLTHTCVTRGGPCRCTVQQHKEQWQGLFAHLAPVAIRTDELIRHSHDTWMSGLVFKVLTWLLWFNLCCSKGSSFEHFCFHDTLCFWSGFIGELVY